MVLLLKRGVKCHERRGIFYLSFFFFFFLLLCKPMTPLTLPFSPLTPYAHVFWANNTHSKRFGPAPWRTKQSGLNYCVSLIFFSCLDVYICIFLAKLRLYLRARIYFFLWRRVRVVGCPQLAASVQWTCNYSGMHTNTHWCMQAAIVEDNQGLHMWFVHDTLVFCGARGETVQFCVERAIKG